MRDDFTKPTVQAIAGRAGYRCSNPDCRRGTIRPDPAEPERARTIGVAAHITAASPRGPRYDASLSREERTSAENGVLLCEVCATAVDDAPNAYSVETLKAWKRGAEENAARESRATSDEISSLLGDLVDLGNAVNAFAADWSRNEPTFDMDDWTGSNERSDRYRKERSAAYRTELGPAVTSVLQRCEVVFGTEQPQLQEAQFAAMAAATNALAAGLLATALYALATVLAIR